jgi:hypothetical protein
MPKVLEISKSDLAGARDTGNREYLESIFRKAEEVVREGGSVYLMQVFSEVFREVADIIDSLQKLEDVKKFYLR